MSALTNTGCGCTKLIEFIIRDPEEKSREITVFVMKIMIHACPQRMWYVEDLLIPQLLEQGADSVAIWNDDEGLGNLEACMRAFRHCAGHGGTWHIQDDVLPCRDFVQRCREYESDGIVYGFCNEQFRDDPENTGRVRVSDAWHSFQCVRIPDDTARECSEWFYSGGWRESTLPELAILKGMKKGDDSFFREFLLMRRSRSSVTNAEPNLVEHVDWIVGGSILSPWRGFLARAYYWEDEALVEDLKQQIMRLRGA